MDNRHDKASIGLVDEMLSWIGEDITRPGLLETPSRVIKAWNEWFSGYDKDPAALFKTFEDGAEKYDEMVLQGGCPLYSHCEHHMAPFFGFVHIGYIPNGKIIGLSKMLRLVDVFARRLTVQERITTQLADCIEKHLEPLGVGVVVQARHLCIESRGVGKPGSITTTSALRGAMKTDTNARSEFLEFARSSAAQYRP
jgi:GTP cyclohydrolase I